MEETAPESPSPNVSDMKDDDADEDAILGGGDDCDERR